MTEKQRVAENRENESKMVLMMCDYEPTLQIDGSLAVTQAVLQKLHLH